MNTVIRNPRDAALIRLDDLVWKGIVKAATDAVLPANTRTENVLIADDNGAFPAVDGVTITTNGTAGLNDGTEAGSDKILVKDEATGANNGKYFLSDPGSAGQKWRLTRTSDANASSEVTAGFYIFADQGTANPNSTWVITTDDPITLNTTSITFGKFSGLGQIIAGTGMTKTGDTLNVIGGDGIVANADDIAVDFNTTNLKITAGQLNTIQDIDTTASPTFAGLHILESNTDTVPAVEIEQTSTGDAALQFSIVGDAYAMGIDNTDADKFKISYASAAGTAVLGTNDLFVINSAGLVGIGTNAPLVILHIIGTGTVSQRIEQTSNVGVSVLSCLNNTGIIDQLSMINWGTTATGTSFGLSNNNLAVLSKSGNGNLTIGTVGTGFLVLGTNDTEILRLTATGIGSDVFVDNGFGMVIGHTAKITAGNAPEVQILGTGGADTAMLLGRWSNASGSAKIDFVKSRNATIGSNTIVSDNDQVGRLRFFPDDGVDFATLAASFDAEVDDASPAVGDVGMAFVWQQMPGGGGALAETMRLTPAGHITLSKADPRINFQGTAGGSGGILYLDSTSALRNALVFPGSDLVVLSNRAANGTVEIRANTSTAGSGGEVTIATFTDTNVGIGVAPNVNRQLDVGGAFNGNTRLSIADTLSASAEAQQLFVGGTIEAVANQNAHGIRIAPTLVKAGSGTHADLNSAQIQPPVITANSSTLTNATALKITGAPTGAINNRALWVSAGRTELTGELEVGGNLGFFGTTPIAQETGVAVTAAGIHAALVNYGLIT